MAIEAAQEKQAAEVTLLDLEGLGAFTDYFLLCTGFSARQVDAICDEIERRLARIGIRLMHREGKAGAEWMLLDFGSLIVHVFTERARHFYDLERLWRAARRIEFERSRRNGTGARRRGGRGMSEPRMAWIAEDPASKAVVELARKVADTSTTLLITGESGTGKDHLARLIHELGPRRDAPFLKIDCASLPQELVESELFGHERGAFTGAVERKLGRLEMAGAGTIVLDEVAALSPATQSKLLRVLEERQFERLGGTETITIEARLVALTNSDLCAPGFRRQVPRGSIFPPERADDCRARAARASRGHPAACRRAARARGARTRPRSAWFSRNPCAACSLTTAGPATCANSRIPSSARWSSPMASTLLPEDFPESVRMGDSGFGVALRSLEDIERDAIRATLEATHYKISKSAEILGISRKTLLDKRKKYGLN